MASISNEIVCKRGKVLTLRINMILFGSYPFLKEKNIHYK